VSERTRLTRWLVVRVSEKRFAMPASVVRAVLPARPPAPLPLGRPALAGITLFRGRVLPLVDPHDTLGLDGPAGDAGAIVVVGHAGGFGILVSEVLGMVSREEGLELSWGRKPVEPLDPALFVRDGLVREDAGCELKEASLDAEEELEEEHALQSAAPGAATDEE
jgi:hypothetical protein